MESYTSRTKTTTMIGFNLKRPFVLLFGCYSYIFVFNSTLWDNAYLPSWTHLAFRLSKSLKRKAKWVQSCLWDILISKKFLIWVNKLVSNNVSKDRSFRRYLVLDILPNPYRVTLTKKVTFWGKITVNFAVYVLLLKIKIVPLLKS